VSKPDRPAGSRGKPVWISKAVVLALHDEQIAEHGGLGGVRDEGMLDSSLARPQNRWYYEGAGLVELAAAYGFGVARNHPFADGNKRTSFVVTKLFLALNAVDLKVTEPEIVETWLALADSRSLMSEERLSTWLLSRCEVIR
jgi:death-on-curing protein